jgi:hypothetical protein
MPKISASRSAEHAGDKMVDDQRLCESLLCNYDGMLNGKPFKADAFSAQFNTNNEFKLGKG